MQANDERQIETEWSETTKRTVAIAAVLIGVFVLYLSRSVIPFIVVAVILAFLLNPIIGFFSPRLRMPRWLAVILVYLLLLIVLMLLPLIFIPAVIDAVRAIDIDIVNLLEKATAWLQQSLESIRYLNVLKFQVNLSPLVDPALEMLTGVVPEAMVPSPEQIFNSLPSALELAKGVASTVVGAVIWTLFAFLFTLIYSIYVSLDWPLFGTAFLEVIPPSYRAEYAHLGFLIRRIWGAYFRGQLFVCLTIGVIVGVGDAALGVPGALVLGIVAGLLEVLPNIGPILSAVPAVLIALLQGSSVLPVSNGVFALIVIAFYFIAQQVENNIVVPRIIGQAVDVHPVVLMAGVIVGASAGGLLGALMAAPLIATGRILAQYAYNKMMGRPPFPPETAPPILPQDARQVQAAEAPEDEVSLKSLPENRERSEDGLAKGQRKTRKSRRSPWPSAGTGSVLRDEKGP